MSKLCVCARVVCKLGKLCVCEKVVCVGEGCV